MKIRAVRIGSFGKYQNWTMDDIPDGLTLITGRNESGKTTLMEFMRSTMFPGTRRSTYPLPSKTDSGSMDLELESGEKLTIKREQKKIQEIYGGKLPEELFAMDSDTYRSIFAMDLKDLADADAISSESIRKRFLTIPGGEMVPQVIKDISTKRKELMNDDRHTDNNPIGSLLKDIREINVSIAKHREDDSEYDGYARESSEISAKLERLNGMQRIVETERERRRTILAQVPNLNAIAELRSEASGLEYSRNITDEAEVQFSTYVQKISELEGSLNGLEREETTTPEELQNIKDIHSELRSFLKDEEKLSTRKEELKDKITEDEEFIEQMNVSPELATKDRRDRLEGMMKGRRPYGPILLLLGIALAAVGVFMDMNLMIIAAGAAAAAGGVLLWIFGRREGPEKWMARNGYPSVPRDRVHSFVAKLEKVDAAYSRIKENEDLILEIDVIREEAEMKASDVMDELGEPYINVRNASEIIGSRVKEEEDKIQTSIKIEELESGIESAKKNMDAIAGPYGGNEGFLKACADRKRLITVESQIEGAVKGIEAATGMTVDEVERESKKETNDDPDLKDEIAQLQQRTGELKEKMDSLITDRSMGTLLTERNAMTAELKEKAREWAILSLEGRMIDSSCSELYGKMQPSVISTANRYLQLMTAGRYSIDPDPRLEEIVIKDSVSQKTSKQWSSGLGDQVYLSIKMAVAKEMGSERLPMMLDDVLVRFDQERKRGACSAILDFAKDQQVFLFSCDPSVGTSFSPGTVFNRISL